MTDEQALKRISANMRRLRNARGLSMSQLAKMVGTFPSNIKRIEDEEHVPGVGFLTRIAEALEVDWPELLAEVPTKVSAKAS